MKGVFFRSALLAISLLAIHACNKDDQEAYNVSLVTVCENQDTTPKYYYQLGSGSGLDPNTGKPTVSMLNKRYFIWYNVLGENSRHMPNKGYDIRLLQIKSILTKHVIKLNKANSDSIGNDRVHVLDIWASGGFINVSFAFEAGNSSIHYINLVENTLVNHPSDGKNYLELRHNSHNSSTQYMARGFVCFDIRAFQPQGNNEAIFVIKVKDIDGSERTYEIKYNFTPNTNASDQNDPTHIADEYVSEGAYH